MRIHDLLERAQRLWPQHTAVIDGDMWRDYRHTGERVHRLAGALRSLLSGDRAQVAILARNSHRFLESYFACAQAGCVAVPVNARLAPAEIAWLLDDAQVRVVLGDGELLAGVPAGMPRIAFDGAADGARDYEDLLAHSAALASDEVAVAEDDLAQLCYTGGTTGTPKGVMLTHRNVVASAVNKILLGEFRGDDVWLHAAPMFHQADAWAVFSFTALGAAHVFASRFDARSVLELIARERVTATQIVPTMLYMLLDAEAASDAALSSLRRVLYGSAPMPIGRLRDAIDRLGPIFQHIYGQTESTGTMTATEVSQLRALAHGGDARLASCGREILGVQVKVADAQGRPLRAGQIGTIHARGPTVMRGYWCRPEETRQALRGGWLDTGDLGHMDEQGHLYIVDRARDVILSGGENVYPTEVEHALCAHAAVAEAAVIGMPDAKWGEAVVAIVTLRGSASATVEELLAHCRTRIAGYKCPKRIELVDALPKSAAGKILKTQLRAARVAAGPPGPPGSAA
jgi:long-chain acyl-CoA synthetase